MSSDAKRGARTAQGGRAALPWWRWGRYFPNRPEAESRARSLVGRLFTALVVTALLIYAAAVAGLWWTGGQLIEDSARKQAVQWLAELDELGTPLYASRRPDPVMRTVHARLRQFPEITHVRYYDATGTRLLADYRRGGRELPAFTPRTFAATHTGTDNRPYQLTPMQAARLRVSAPLQMRVLAADSMLDLGRARARQSTKVIGYLDFVFDAGAQRLQFQRSLVAGSVALAVVLCVAVVLGRRKVKQAMAPLTALEEPLARLARGDMNVDISGGGDREIVAIREALNTTIAAFKERDESLRRAECDALTGLVNQRYFKRQLALECSRIERDGETSAVLCIDLDRFRQVNKALGTAAGDRLLGQVASLLRARIRENDLLARLDGDEFVALVRGVNRDGAVKVARSINQVMHDFQFSAGDDSFPIRASIGVAMVDPHAEPDGVVGLAVAACAQAKARGGDRFFMDGNDETSVVREADSPAWSRHVRTAIHDNALKFVYQPIVDPRGAPHGEMYELLLRLAAPGGQLVSPTAFFPVADRFGLMAELDRWVIRRACEELAQLQASGRKATFFVNLSGHVFEEGDVLKRVVAEELARHELNAQYLVFEITEQVAIRHLNQARRVIEELGALGCRFALDDFGSGFSSLNYLKHLPAAFLKISGTFVQNVVADPLDEVMVRSIVQIAQALHMQTVAESVEDGRTFARIAELGVDFAQGHFIARPAEALPQPGALFNQAPRLGLARPTGAGARPGPRPLVRKR